MTTANGRALNELRTAVSRAQRALPNRARSLRDVSRAGRESARRGGAAAAVLRIWRIGVAAPRGTTKPLRQVVTTVVMAAPTSGAVSRAGAGVSSPSRQTGAAVGMWKSRVRGKNCNRTGRRSRGLGPRVRVGALNAPDQWGTWAIVASRSKSPDYPEARACSGTGPTSPRVAPVQRQE